MNPTPINFEAACLRISAIREAGGVAGFVREVIAELITSTCANARKRGILNLPDSERRRHIPDLIRTHAGAILRRRLDKDIDSFTRWITEQRVQDLDRGVFSGWEEAEAQCNADLDAFVDELTRRLAQGAV